MTQESEQATLDIVLHARRSQLPAAKVADAMRIAAGRIKKRASEDPVDRLADEIVDHAMRESTRGDARSDFLKDVAVGIDIAAIDLESQVRNDGWQLEKAVSQFMRGETYDLSRVSPDGAKAFVEAALRETSIRDGAPPEAVNALLRSLSAMPRNTALGSDEMFSGAMQQSGLTRVQTHPEVTERVRGVIKRLTDAF